ncbi:MAG: 2-oxo acid dehydrogenase subunit E2, partial [Oscillospiraceae bacterium]|nr:2-oxo acid dehydrogenase subunit E2 [Oscillospiraceae bacterium]
VTGYRGGEHDNTGDAMNLLNKLPRWLSKLAIHFLMWMDKHGWVPQSIIANDANYASVFLTNLGSIKLKCGYHHLSTWGTTSMFCVIGEKKWSPIYDQNGFVEMRETLDIGLTIDERIADGYYYAKSIRLFKHLLAHPELLERPLNEEVDYE